MIGSNVLEGKPFDGVFIFDIHAHLHSTSDFQMTHTSAREVTATMDRLGISGGCVSSILSIHADCRLGNRMMLDAVDRYPGKLRGYVTVSPYDNGVDLDGFFRHPGVKGLKVHAAFHRSSIDDPRYEPFFEYADKKGLPVLFHAWEAADTVNIARLAARYPNTKLIIGHGAMRVWEVKREVIAAVRKYENVFADTTVSVAYDGAIEDAVRQLGADRLCYGSDIPFYDCRHVVGKVATSRLTDSEKEKVLGLNAKRILGLTE
ncbi:MAG: amidohydrolase family protein [Clostridia bacterium]|nr:amidohydrolase family protein [Clostridia bacterium]MCR5689855.1 amidohydrolase family protein [Clostridiales bacterium]